MALGPGKYDALCTLVRQRAHARAALVIVLEGSSGTGFSMQAPPDVTFSLPEILRTVADEIDASFKEGKV